MTAVDDLAAWLTQIWDELEAKARAADPGPWEWIETGPPNSTQALVGGDGRLMIVPSRTPDVFPSTANARFMEANHPAAVLARIAADRQILKRCAEIADMSFIGLDLRPRDMSELAAAILADLALPHAGRPGYQEAWRPA